jgi:hypothetical protein
MHKVNRGFVCASVRLRRKKGSDRGWPLNALSGVHDAMHILVLRLGRWFRRATAHASKECFVENAGK